MSDPYDMLGAAKAVAQAVAKRVAAQKQVTDLARGVSNLANQKASSGKTIKAASSSGSYTPVGNSGSSTGVGTMPAAVNPSDNMATLLQAAQGMSSADIAALMEAIKANYATYGGDLQTQGTEWLQSLLGANFDPNDPNYAAMMADPAIAAYMGSMEAMGETADQNMITDLNWFLKQQAAYNQYLQSLALTSGTGVSGGGGGGGGYGGRGYGGGGGSGGNDSVDVEWSDPRTKLDAKVSNVLHANNNYLANSPEFWNAVMATAGTESEQGELEDLLNRYWTAGIPELLSELTENRQLTEEERAQAVEDQLSNDAWLTGAPIQFQTALDEYMTATGRADPFAEPDPATINLAADADFVEDFGGVYNTAFDPNRYPGGADTLAARTALINTPWYRPNYLTDELRNQHISNAANRRQVELPQATVDDSAIQEQIDYLLSGPGEYRFTDPQETFDLLANMQYPQYITSYIENNPGEFSPEVLEFISNEFATRPEYGSTAWGPVIQTIANARNIQEAPGLNISPGVMSAQRALGDPEALRFFFADTYGGLSTEDRALVNALMENQNVRIPNAALAATNKKSIDPRKNLLEFAQDNKTDYDPISSNQVLLDSVMGDDGTLRPDILEAMKRYSQQWAVNQSHDGIEYIPRPGEVWMEDVPTDTDVSEMDLSIDLMNRIIEVAQAGNYNPNSTLAQINSNMREQAQQSNSAATSQYTYDPLATELTSGDANNYAIEELDDFFGGGTENYGGQYGFASPRNRLREVARNLTSSIKRQQPTATQSVQTFQTTPPVGAQKTPVVVAQKNPTSATSALMKLAAASKKTKDAKKIKLKAF